MHHHGKEFGVFFLGQQLRYGLLKLARIKGVNGFQALSPGFQTELIVMGQYLFEQSFLNGLIFDLHQFHGPQSFQPRRFVLGIEWQSNGLRYFLLQAEFQLTAFGLQGSGILHRLTVTERQESKADDQNKQKLHGIVFETNIVKSERFGMIWQKQKFYLTLPLTCSASKASNTTSGCALLSNTCSIKISWVKCRSELNELA